MKKILAVVSLLFCCPTLAFALPDTLNFTPDMNDLSVKFLGVIFGNVEGVGLYGSGSQIIGEMFYIFNAAVLALGGLILIYMVLVSTLVTAQDGQLLGRKWNSMWVPVRTVLGMALLVPQASGYCIAQIIVMWIVLQGVGAANMIWGAALDYIHRGGVVVMDNKAMDDPSDKDAAGTVKSAGDFVSSQVCMVALEEALKKSYKRNHAIGRCDVALDSAYWCKPVPNFINSPDFVSAYRERLMSGSPSNPEVQFPDFPEGEPYSPLNGVCGSVAWERFNEKDMTSMRENIGGDSKELLEQAAFARTLGVQQMYINLSSVSRAIVGNQAQTDREARPPIPLGKPSQDGTRWITAGSGSPLLRGNELLGAAAVYQSILAPTMNLVHNDISDNLEFIPSARDSGWIMAGSYYYDIVKLNKEMTSILDKEGKVIPDKGHADQLLSAEVIQDLIRRGGLAQRDVELINVLMNGGSGPGGIVIVRDDSVGGYVENAGKVKNSGSVEVKVPDLSLSGPNIAGMFSGSAAIKWGFGLAPLIAKWHSKTQKIVEKVERDWAWGKLILQIKSAIGGIFMAAGLIFKMALADGARGEMNPVIILAGAGNQLIDSSIQMLLQIALDFGTIAGNNTAEATVLVVVAFLLPLIVSLLTVMLAMGMLLALYIPLLPYLIFTLGAVAWLIGVIEAMVAAPIVALGVMHPEGDDVFGKGDKALMLLLSVFLRPGMMVIGFFFGFILSHVGVWLLNVGFGEVITQVQRPLIPLSSAIGYFFMFVLYCYIAVAIISKSFSLIHHLPDKILRWLQGGIEESLGSGTGQMLDQVQGKMESTGQSISGGAGSATSGAMSAGQRAGENVSRAAPGERLTS